MASARGNSKDSHVNEYEQQRPERIVCNKRRLDALKLPSLGTQQGQPRKRRKLKVSKASKSSLGNAVLGNVFMDASLVVMQGDSLLICKISWLLVRNNRCMNVDLLLDLYT